VVVPKIPGVVPAGRLIRPVNGFIIVSFNSIVVTGVIVTTFRKYLSGQPEENKTRKRFAFLLKQTVETSIF